MFVYRLFSISMTTPFLHVCLQAVLYLYDNMHSSMLPLGNIRIENIYVEKKGICKVGGYESAFLGYGSWLQQQVKDADHAPSMDVIMFGEHACRVQVT